MSALASTFGTSLPSFAATESPVWGRIRLSPRKKAPASPTLLSDMELGRVRAHAWENIVAELETWASSRGEDLFGDDTPTTTSILVAIGIIQSLSTTDSPIPTRVGITIDNGVALEWRTPNLLDIVEISGSGAYEVTRLVNGRVTYHDEGQVPTISTNNLLF